MLVGALKAVQCTAVVSVAERLGLSVTVRVRVRARAKECDFSILFFFCVEVTNTFVLHVNGSCNIHGVRTTKVRDVTMMWERYITWRMCPLDTWSDISTN